MCSTAERENTELTERMERGRTVCDRDEKKQRMMERLGRESDFRNEEKGEQRV